MKHRITYTFVLLMSVFPLYGQVTDIGRLQYDDANYNLLYDSTIASKNRIIQGERKSSYNAPHIYRYRLQAGEDIWTIIAKTSLNIDSIATLNRIDFIGMLHQDVDVYLPDTLGVFFQADTQEVGALAERFDMPEEAVLSVQDPLQAGKRLYFVPEKTLFFLERVYLTGVVFHAPLLGRQSSNYGLREDPFVNEKAFHGGVDIATKEGKLVHASRHGTVIYADEANGYGLLVVVAHDLGYHTLYAHLAEILVEYDQYVDTGHVLGKAGSTGRSTGPHLHFEIRRYREPLNPENIPFFLERINSGRTESAPDFIPPVGNQ
ncbi:MAG: M23 family metallopeptidase [Spirochaetes bacterium]|nr:M23 family metallopeptidase [Spirochaetota bacterium]